MDDKQIVFTINSDKVEIKLMYHHRQSLQFETICRQFKVTHVHQQYLPKAFPVNIGNAKPKVQDTLEFIANHSLH